jgi:hypothetical protein
MSCPICLNLELPCVIIDLFLSIVLCADELYYPGNLKETYDVIFLMCSVRNEGLQMCGFAADDYRVHKFWHIGGGNMS